MTPAFTTRLQRNGLTVPARASQREVEAEARRSAILTAIHRNGALTRAGVASALKREDDRILSDDLQTLKARGLVTCDGRKGSRNGTAFWRIVEGRA